MTIPRPWLPMLAVLAVAGPPLAATEDGSTEEEPRVWVLRFGFDGAVLADEHRAMLDEAAAALLEDASLRAQVVGHSDNQGPEPANLQVSWQRAEAVAAYLVQGRGIAPDRISLEAEGSHKPVAANETRAGRLRNRRVVVALRAANSADRRRQDGTWILRFDFGGAELSAAHRALLAEVASELTRNPALGALVVGHSDSSGQEPINLEISRRRAEAVASHLALRWRIDQSRIRTQGKGSSRPVAPNDTHEGQRRNRRVVVVLKDPAAARPPTDAARDAGEVAADPETPPADAG